MGRSRIIRNIRLGVKSLLLHKLRSMLTMLGMVFGVASVIGMLAVGEGSKRQAIEEFERLGTNNIIVSSRRPLDSGDSANQSSRRILIYGLKYMDHQRIMETLSGTTAVVPVKKLRKRLQLIERQLVTDVGRIDDLKLIGTTPRWFTLIDRPLIAGRHFNLTDERRLNPVVVLTEKLARRLLVTDHTIGASVNIGGKEFTVIGIIESATEGPGSMDEDIDAFMPLSTCEAAFGDIVSEQSAGQSIREQVELHQIVVQMAERDDVSAGAAVVKRMLKRFHDNVDYEVSVPLELLRKAERVQGVMNLMLSAIAGISLLVGGIGIMNIMLASVTERTREIGIRRAIGAKRAQIIGQFLIEALLLSILGGVIGLVLGTWGLPGAITYMSSQMEQPIKTIVPGYSIVLSLGISLVVGVAFGMYPAMRASRLDPIIVLRHE